MTSALFIKVLEDWKNTMIQKGLLHNELNQFVVQQPSST